jgi:Flp pilus assembly pilin Flp
MIGWKNPTRRLASDARGAAAVEYALIMVPLVALLLGLIDLGFRAYVGVVLQGGLNAAARQVTVSNTTTAAQITTLIRTRIKKVLPFANVVVSQSSYDNFSHVGKPEPITTDTAPIGTYNTGDCFLDINGNGVWNADAGTSGTGSSDDIVYYTATVTYTALVPVRALFGTSSTETVAATALFKNQPYASQVEPATVCT